MNHDNPSTNDCQSKLHDFASANPSSALLIAAGCGLALGLLMRTIFPHPPESRASRLLADVRDRLHDFSEPIQRHTESLLETGANAVKSGVSQLHDLHLERGLQSLGSRLKKLFS